MPTATRTAARQVHVEHCMGTVFTIDIRDTGSWGDVMHDVVTWLHHVDAVFSTYRPDSDISRMQRGELRLRDAALEIPAVLDLCADVQLETGGYFTAMKDGAIDPTGLVKGWTVEHASALLRACGSANHAVNGGGDIQLAGEAAPGRPWRVGISDPRDRTEVLSVVEGRDLAVATSGNAERGRHILNPFTRQPSDACLSATVVGPSLARADAYATAAFVMGDLAPGWADALPGYEVLLVTATGTTRRSNSWPE